MAEFCGTSQPEEPGEVNPPAGLKDEGPKKRRNRRRKSKKKDEPRVKDEILDERREDNEQASPFTTEGLEETYTHGNPSSQSSMQLTEQGSCEVSTLDCASCGRQEQDKKSGRRRKQKRNKTKCQADKELRGPQDHAQRVKDGTLDSKQGQDDPAVFLPSLETRLVNASGEATAQASLQHASETNEPTSIQILGNNTAVFMGPVNGSTFNFYHNGRQNVADHPTSKTPPEKPQSVSTHGRDTAGFQPVEDTSRQSEVNAQVGDACRRSDVYTQVGDTCPHSDVSTQVRNTYKRSDVHTHNGDTCRIFDVNKKVGDTYRNSADQSRAKLTKHYKRTGSYVQLIPWVNDDKMHIMDIYVKLHLQKTEGCAVARKKAETLIDYEKIFQMKTREGDLVNRVIFCGMAGLGKSTLFDKIAYDWAVGSNEVLTNYKLVFVLKMCSLDQRSDLIESIFDQLLGDSSGISKEELKFFIYNNPDEVLILLDGFDELITTSLSEPSFGSVLRSLQTMNYEGCIALTTRPSHLEKLMGPSLVQNPCTHVKVLGFTQNDVRNYISKFYHDDLVSAESLITKIKSSDVLSDLTRSPMMLLLICLIWREKSGLPDTISQLYTEALTYIFKRKDPGFEDSMSTVLVEVGKVALSGLLAGDQKLSFVKSDFNKMEFDIALKVGILSSQRVLKNLNSHQCVQFIHKTVQEFCAAKYWQSLQREPEKFQKILDTICQEGKNIYQFEYLLHFCCGNNQKCLGRVLDYLSSRLLDGDGALHRLLIHCYFEAQLIEGTTDAPIKLLAIPQICVQKEHTEYFKALLHFLKYICELEDRKMHLVNCQSLHISGICLGGSPSMKSLAVALGNMSNLAFLDLTECSLAYRDVKLLTYYLIDGNQLTQLDLSGNDALGGNARLWAACLKSVFASLKVIKLRKCNLQSEDVEHILMTISQITTLIELDLSGNHYLGGTANVWSASLLMTHLEYLRLSDCRLRGEDLEHVAAALSKMNKLTHLDLSVNSALGGYAELWARYLCHLRHLHKFDLGFCSLKCEDIRSIALYVTDLTNLKVIVLAGNRALGGKVQMWVSHLHYMQHVEKLDLSKCSFRGKDIESLAVYLSERRHVIELDLSNNSALVGSAEDWSPHLCLMTHVQKLDLSGCLLILKDVKHVAMSLSGMRNLRRLILSMNSKWQGSAATWSGHLEHLKYLQELCLRCCFLTSTDIEHVAKVLSEMMKLTHLDLSANNTLGGSAHLWFCHLPLMKYLQNLDLSDCSLTGTDVAHIASSLRDMEQMLELTLSRNTALGGSAGLWAHHLPHLKYLQQITLSRCMMTCTDKSKISQALNLMTNTLCVTY